MRATQSQHPNVIRTRGTLVIQIRLLYVPDHSESDLETNRQKGAALQTTDVLHPLRVWWTTKTFIIFPALTLRKQRALLSTSRLGSNQDRAYFRCLGRKTLGFLSPDHHRGSALG